MMQASGVAAVLKTLSRKMLSQILAVAILAGSVPVVSAADTPDAQLFTTGINNYKKGDYAAVIVTMTEILGKYPQTPLRDMTLFWLARAHFKTGNQHQAARNLSQFKKEFPDNPLTDKMEEGFAALVTRYEQGERLEGAAAPLTNLANTPDPQKKPEERAVKALPVADDAAGKKFTPAKVTPENTARDTVEAVQAAAVKAEAERVAADRRAATRAAEERLRAEQAENARLAEAKAAEQTAAAQAAAAKAEAERVVADRLAAAKAADERLRAEQVESARRAEEKVAEQLAAAKAAAAKAEAELVAAEKAAAERIAAANAATEKADAERRVAEKLVQQYQAAAAMALKLTENAKKGTVLAPIPASKAVDAAPEALFAAERSARQKAEEDLQKERAARVKAEAERAIAMRRAAELSATQLPAARQPSGAGPAAISTAVALPKLKPLTQKEITNNNGLVDEGKANPSLNTVIVKDYATAKNSGVPAPANKPVVFSELSPEVQSEMEFLCFAAKAKGRFQFEECIKAKLLTNQ